MLIVRPSRSRGQADHGWLQSQHSFSFANYYDPSHMGFRDLRVINQDVVAAGAGFPTHPHRDMEIISYVIDGALEHKDSLGNGSVVRPGDVQRMTAGTGVRHSEFNSSSDAELQFLQIWIQPERTGIEPGYEQRLFDEAAKTDRLCLVVSPDGAEESVQIHQDVRLYASLLGEGKTLSHRIEEGRHAWLQVVSGSMLANGQALSAGDGAAISDEAAIELCAQERAHFLLFDLS